MSHRNAAALAALAFSLNLPAPVFAQSATQTRLLSSPHPSAVGQAVTLAAEVDGLGGGAPTGPIVFSDGATRLGASSLRYLGAGQATITAGFYHTCSLTAAGGVQCWGDNRLGQLGDGTRAKRLTLTPVLGLSSGIVAVASGIVHTCALTSAGAVKCWGSNYAGQLGDGTTTDRPRPTPVVGLSRGVVAIATGWRHSCALTRLGAVLCWGFNGEGAIGDGTTINRPTPTAASGLSRGVAALAAGGTHSCALTNAGTALCWGDNRYGQIGDGATTRRLTPTPVTGLPSGLVAIAGGGYHTCALTNARIPPYCWGRNDKGQLGDGTTTDRLTPTQVLGLSNGAAAIAPGGEHTCAVSYASGAAKCWGFGLFGRLGIDVTVSRRRPSPVVGLSGGVTAIAASPYGHSCAVTSAGNILCWGHNGLGELGDGTTTKRTVPVAVIGPATLVRAQATFSTNVLGVGLHTLQASYPGDAAHGPSDGTITQRVR